MTAWFYPTYGANLTRFETLEKSYLSLVRVKTIKRNTRSSYRLKYSRKYPYILSKSCYKKIRLFPFFSSFLIETNVYFP